MNIIRQTKPNAQGKRRVTVEVDADEMVLLVRKTGHYRLGGQIDDVVESHVIEDSRPVYWCHFEQKWVDS